MSQPIPAGWPGETATSEVLLEGSARTAPPREMLRVLGVLADENRFRIVELLSAGAELPCSAVGRALGLSPSLVSHHLAILEDAGLVGRRKDGLWTMNRLRRSVLFHHLSALSERLG